MGETKDIVVDRYKEKFYKNETNSGVKLKDYYTPNDTAQLRYEDINDPGQFPFVRGIHANMYRGKIWTRRMLVGFGTARHSNERLKYCIGLGASGLCIVCDTPTQLCIDSDHPFALNEAGLVGVPFTSLKDMEDLLAGIAIDRMSISLQTPGDPGPIMFSMLIACAQKRGKSLQSLSGSTSNEALLKLFGYDTLNPMDISLKLSIDVVEYCVRNRMRFHPIVVSGYVYRENGLTAVQELGIAMAAASLYIEETIKRGLDIDEIAPRIAMNFSIGSDFFEEIAKFRAVRKMWSKLVKETFGAKDNRASSIAISAHTSGMSLAAKQPINNIIRSGYQLLSGILGGCQAIDLSTYDEPYSTPSDVASRVALNTQNIVAYETGILSVADPLGGAYFLESLTEDMVQEAWKIYETIINMGGIIKAHEVGWVDNLIEEQLLKRQKAIEKKDIIIIGVNEFEISEEDDVNLPIHFNPPGAVENHIENVKKLKDERNNRFVEKALDLIAKKAEKSSAYNLIPDIIEAVKCYATIGEIWGTIRKANGLGYDPFEYLMV